MRPVRSLLLHTGQHRHHTSIHHLAGPAVAVTTWLAVPAVLGGLMLSGPAPLALAHCLGPAAWGDPPTAATEIHLVKLETAATASKARYTAYVAHARAVARARAAARARARAAAQQAAALAQQAATSSPSLTQAPVIQAAPPAPSGGWQSIVASMTDASSASCLDSIIERESGGNVYATNPISGAYGIPQALPGDKMASAGADWQTNPVTQIRWMIGYVDGTYGSPCAAWAFWQTNGSY